MKYYHITKNSKKVKDSILKNGLRCNEDGDIYLFENMAFKINGVTNNVSDAIAANQLFLKQYLMFEIDSDGLTVELQPDAVGEFSASMQWFVKQPVIAPAHIDLFGRYSTRYLEPYHLEIKKACEDPEEQTA